MWHEWGEVVAPPLDGGSVGTMTETRWKFLGPALEGGAEAQTVEMGAVEMKREEQV